MTTGRVKHCDWNIPPKTLNLPHAEIHVWRASLNADSAWQQRLAQTLSEEEHYRANRFHFEKDRAHFIVGRGILRVILGGYLKLNSEQVPIGYTPFGKPILAEPLHANDLQFNLSHSDGLALYAFGHSHPLGIDLERTRPDFATAEIAQRFFAPGEVATLQALSPELQPRAFFDCWTRKEAYLKAKGSGLSVPLDSFEVSLTPGEPAVLLKSQIDSQEPQRWSLLSLNPGPGYAAALAVEGRVWQLKCWRFEG